MNEGVGIRDMRVGFKATYGKWYFRGDVSYSNNKVSLKDVYLQYSFNENNFLRAGHYTAPFGLSSAYSSAKKEYLDEPEGNIYQPGRRIGVMHTISNHNLWFQYGAFADNSALTTSTDKSGPQGYTVSGRFVYRPIMTDAGGFHVGFNTDGFYISARGIIINPADYKYNYACSGVDNPADKNLELMLGFGYLNLKDAKALADAPIAGMAKAGRMSDLSAGLSFFWNKYVTLRLNYHYIHSHTWDQPSAKVVNVVQMRVQYMF